MDSANQTIFKSGRNKEEKKLDSLVSKSNRIIYRTQTVFPFDLFPDDIIIDEMKIEVISRTFFHTEQRFPMLLKNVHGVTISSSLFFSSVSFEVMGVELNPGQIPFIWNSDATKIRRIVTGLAAALKDGIDLSQIPLEQLRNKVEEIGRTGPNK